MKHKNSNTRHAKRQVNMILGGARKFDARQSVAEVHVFLSI